LTKRIYLKFGYLNGYDVLLIDWMFDDAVYYL